MFEKIRDRKFFYSNFKNYKHYEKMHPVSDWPARLYGTNKTHKLEHPQDMNRETIKFQPITHQTSTYTYNAAQVISNYLKPLCKNKYIVNGTQSFFQELSTLLHLKNEGYVSYNVESVFAKVSFTRNNRLYHRSNLCAEKINVRLYEVKI